MTRGCLTCATVVLCLFTSARALSAPLGQIPPAAPAGGADVTLFRVFLTDGTSLVSYGEIARVGDRVVFSMPTSASATDPALQLVDLAANRVDWTRTANYADAARANRYVESQAVYDYAQLSNDVAQALNEVTDTADPAKRLAVAERARKMLADWPSTHFNYKLDDVRQMLGMLDEAIAGLRVASGSGRVDLTFVAVAAPPPPAEPLMPPPTPREAIEQLLKAATVADLPAERTTLLSGALSGLERDAGVLPPEWAASTGAAIKADIAKEQTTDRSYQALTDSMLGLAKTRARAADVRGLERLLLQIHARDEVLGRTRPDVVKALIDSVETELDAAQRLQLARDQWTLREPIYRRYRTAIAASLLLFAQLQAPLENIKSLAGSSPYALASIERETGEIRRAMSRISPPEQLEETHALLSSAVEMADSAARIRREAALTGEMTRAWDASAAAAGSLMLVARARSELQALLRMPQLPK